MKIQRDKDGRQETHQQQHEAEGRQEQQQEMKEEEHAVPTAVEEVKVYQEELETRKKIDIFAQPSSVEYLRLLKNDTNLLTTESQVKMENIFVEQGVKSKKPFQSKIQPSLDRPLEREPRVKVSVPKPVPRGEEQDITEHKTPLDGRMYLDRENQSKTFGFYGKNFRKDHNSALDFMKYRTAEPVQHPNARFNIVEDEFVSTYVDLFYYCPTPEDYFNNKVITYTCEDHLLRIADDNRMRQRSEKAKQDFVKNKEVLATQVKLAGKDEMAYDDLITDTTELFLSGEAISRDKDSVGSSPKSLTVLFWNLGNWQRGNNWKVPSNLEYQKLFYKENKPDEYPCHIPQDNNLFLQMVKNLRAHFILNCEATTLLPYHQYLEDQDKRKDHS